MDGMSEKARHYLHSYAQAYKHGYFSLNDWYTLPSCYQVEAWQNIERERLESLYTTPLCVLFGNNFSFTCAYCIELSDSALLVVHTKAHRYIYDIPKDFITDLRNGASMIQLREYWQ